MSKISLDFFDNKNGDWNIGSIFRIKNQLPCGRGNLSYGSGMWSKSCIPA